MTLHAWQDILGYERDSWGGNTQALRHASLLADLCVEVREEASRLPEAFSPTVLLRDFDQTENAIRHFTGMTQHTLATQLSQIKETGHRCLELLDTFLGAHRPQATLAPSTVEDLTAKVESLLAEVSDHLDLDEDTRHFIYVRFEEVRQALLDSSVVGSRSVERSVEALLGSIQRQPDRWQRVGESTLANVIGGVIVALMMAIGQEPKHEMLPPGTPPEVIVEIDVTNDIDVNVGQDGEDVVDGEVVDEDEGVRTN